MRKTDLFCFPFAGGNKYAYRDYARHAPPHLNLVPVEYPGRGARCRESCITGMEALLDDLYRTVQPALRGNYGFYGHSLGGIVAYYLARRLIERGHRPPQLLFITGTTGPSAPPQEDKKRYLLGREAFLAEIRDLGGCPDEVLANDELLAYFEPILRADFQVSETWVHPPGPPLDVPITVVTGTEEDMEAEDIRAWQRETSRPVDFRQLPGKHFFILPNAAEVVALISQKLFPQHLNTYPL